MNRKFRDRSAVQPALASYGVSNRRASAARIRTFFA
jgi:hypothetical protein